MEVSWVPGTSPLLRRGRRPGVVLLAHGSRRGDETPRGTVLAARWLSSLLDGVPVTVAYLESLRPTLAEATEPLVAVGVDTLVVQPLLLGEGQHWHEVATLAEDLERRWPGLSVVVGRPLARHPALPMMLAHRALVLLKGQPQPWGLLLVKAYTRFNGGDLGWAYDLARAVGQALGGGLRVAVAQSGAGPPSVEEAGEGLAALAETVAVMPCILFRGKIWGQDIIPAVDALRERYPTKRVLLSEPIGVDERLVGMLADRVREVLAWCPS